MKRPDGTIMFNYVSNELFDPSIGSGIILEFPAGSILYRLERNSELNLCFYHSSPGTGTRVAKVDLNDLEKSTTVTIFLTWSDKKIGLSVRSRDKIIHGEGQPSKRQFRVDAKGGVMQIGDDEIDIMGITVMENGKEVLSPTAIETWKETIQSVDLLLKGTSPDGFIFESICTNLSIVILVTGFESYCKRRFSELESEGINCNFDELIERFIPKDQRDNTKKVIRERVTVNQCTPTQQLINEKKINFQDYESCKDAYRLGYNIKFEDTGVSSDELRKLKELIKYRHRVIHVSPLRVMPEPDPSRGIGIKPLKNEYAYKGIDIMGKFVTGLHNSSLKLRPES